MHPCKLTIDDVTILVPTHERPSYLNRMLKYYLDQMHIPIIIVDSSREAFSFSSFEKDKLQNVIYLHFPASKYFEKMITAIDLITTKYVVFAPDDDFLIPEAIENCVNFMKKNKDYTSCHGQQFMFHNELFYASYEIKGNFNITYADDAKDKMLNNIGRRNNVYNVFTTDTFKRLFTKKFDFESFMFYWELHILNTIIFSGKHHILNIPYIFKEYIPNSMASQVEGYGDLCKKHPGINHLENFARFEIDFINELTGQHLDLEFLIALYSKHIGVHETKMTTLKERLKNKLPNFILRLIYLINLFRRAYVPKKSGNIKAYDNKIKSYLSRN